MSWQDELAQLDSALASGQISADEYRTRRDRVIAQASGQSVPEQPQQPQQGGDPTQVFRPVNPQTQQPPVGDRTQIVSGNPVPQFPPRPVPPPWETHQPQQPNMSPPPWANEELPPEFGQQSWPRQGPEVFEEKSGGGAGKTVGIIVAVVLVLALAGGAVWFFGFRDKGNDQADNGGGGTSQTQEKTTTTTTSEKPNIPDGPFVELPGDEEVLNHTFSIQEAIANKLPAAGEPELMQSVGVSEIGGLVTNENGMRRGIWAFKLGGGSDPAAVLNAMDTFYQQAKYELVSQEDNVLIRKLTTQDENGQPVTAFRAHYLTDGYMIRVEVYGTDSANVESEFTDLLAQETKKFPPAS
jgi:hypothetical protein